MTTETFPILSHPVVLADSPEGDLEERCWVENYPPKTATSADAVEWAQNDFGVTFVGARVAGLAWFRMARFDEELDEDVVVPLDATGPDRYACEKVTWQPAEAGADQALEFWTVEFEEVR